MQILKAKYEILLPVEPAEILKHLERCGRLCYKSEDKITDDSAEKFVGMIKGIGHASVLEHFSVTVIFTTDRGVTHELVRHRIASYSQESTRYCNYGKGKFGGVIKVIDIEPALSIDAKTKDLPAEIKLAIVNEWRKAMDDDQQRYLKLLELGASPQIARGVLANSLKTEIAATMNLREWQHVFSLRDSFKAHPQMQELMGPLHEEFKKLFPAIF